MDFKAYTLALQREPFDEYTVREILDQFFHHGSAYIFHDSPQFHVQFKRNVSDAMESTFGLKISPFTDIFICGSAHLGFSAVPGDKFGREFIPESSDIDLAIINTELLDAGKRSSTDNSSSVKNKDNGGRLIVRAIDLHSMHEGIEEVDFLQLPVPLERYDVVVCSMVLNCVTTAADRGAMLARFFHFLRPGGLLYLTVPKTCLNLSPFMDRARFEQMLQAVGLHVEEHTKDSPKVAFFVCRRPESAEEPPLPVDAKWKTAKVIWRGKKYRNEFAVTLCDEHVSGRSLSFDKD